MSNFYCEDAYMDSASYYDEDHSWEERGYEVQQYEMPYYYEEPRSMPQYDMPYDYEESQLMSSYDMGYHYEESFITPEYDVHNYYEEQNFPRQPQEYQGQDSYHRAGEESNQEGSSLLSIVAQMSDTQAQMQKNNQLILQQLKELQAHGKMLEMLLAQQASSESMDCFANVDSTKLESENIPDEPQHKDIEESDDEDKYQEPPPYVPPIPFPQRLWKSILKDVMNVNEGYMEKGSKVDEMKEIKRSIIPLSMIEEDDEECIEENMKMEVATHQHIQTLEEYDPLCLEVMFDDELDDSSHIPSSDHNMILDGHIELEDLEPPKYHDFVENSMDPLLEEPSLEVDKGSKEYVEDEAPKFIIRNFEESALIELEASVDDPFLPTIPRNKFVSFEPYISRSFEESSNNPLIPKETNKKGLNLQRKLHSRLGGRKFKWDLKVV